MRARLKVRLWLAMAVLFPALLAACGRSKPEVPRQPAPDPLFSASSNTPRPIPRRLNPIIISNPPMAVQVAGLTNMPPTPPTVTCGAPQTFPCGGTDGIEATLTARVEDANGDAVSVIWSVDGKERYTQQVAAGSPTTVADLSLDYTFTPGDHAIKVTVSDGLLSSVCETTVSLEKDTEEPVIVCPGDIAVFPDPGQCTAVVTFVPTATDNCPDVTVVCQPPSGTAFPIGVTTVTCTATDAAGLTAQCTFDVLVQVANRCPQSDAYWRQNPGAWSVSSMPLGSQLYSRSQLMPLLRATAPGDASLTLARQLIAATLNTARHSDPRPICGVLADANALLASFNSKLPYRVNPSSPAGRSMVELARRLNAYNNGMLTANCVP